MSEAEASSKKAPERLFTTRQPFELSGALQERVDALGVASTIDQLREEGYGYIHDLADTSFNAKLRETILRICKDEKKYTSKGGGTNMLLPKDPIFEEVVLNPKLLAVVEVMCGQGALLSQVAASVRPKGAPPIGLHADQNWTPAPFPVHNQLVTFCWACDEYHEAAGSTKVIPRSHLLRRHPDAEETRAETGAIATECEPGSAVVWDGSTWHSNYTRSIDGERVVLHVTYSRLALRPVECYDFLDESWLQGKPFEMRVLLGREDFLNKIDGAFAQGEKLPRTFDWAKT